MKIINSDGIWMISHAAMAYLKKEKADSCLPLAGKTFRVLNRLSSFPFLSVFLALGLLLPTSSWACYCDCYLSRDCGVLQYCDHNKRVAGSRCSSGAERNGCLCKKPKPPAQNQCANRDKDGAGNCDGDCTFFLGSVCALDDRNTVLSAVGDWGAAIINAGESGGGVIDPALSSRAINAVSDPYCAQIMGREVQSVLVGLAGHDLFHHPPEPHDAEGHHVRDLSGDPCSVTAMRMLVSALESELESPGSAAEELTGLPAQCEGVFARALPCEEGDFVTCITADIETTAKVLTTPPPPKTIERDCNRNGFEDECDVLGEYSADANEDGIPDECDDCEQNGFSTPYIVAIGVVVLALIGFLLWRRRSK